MRPAIGPQDNLNSISVVPTSDGFPVTVTGVATETTLKNVKSRLPPAIGQQASIDSFSVVPTSDGFPVTVTGVATETTLANMSAKLPASLGAKTAAGSFSVVPTSDGFPVTVTGVATETTLASLSAKLPASVGAKTAAGSFSVVPTSDGFPVTVTGVATETTLSSMSAKLPSSLGAKTAAASFSVVPTSDGFPVTVTGVATETTLSNMSAKLPASVGAKSAAGSFSVVPSTDGFAVSITSGLGGVATETTLSGVNTKLDTFISTKATKSSSLNSFYGQSITEGNTLSGTSEDVSQYNYVTFRIEYGNAVGVPISKNKIGILRVQFSHDGSGVGAGNSSRMRIMEEHHGKTIVCAIKGEYMSVSLKAPTITDTTASPTNNNWVTDEWQLTTLLHKDFPTSYGFNMDKQKRAIRCWEQATNVYKIVGAGTSYLTSNFPLPTTVAVGSNELRIGNDSAANGEATTGLRTVLIIGLSESPLFEERYWRAPITPSGNTVWVSGSTKWVRVNEIHFLTYGSNNAPAASSNIRVEMLISASWSTVCYKPYNSRWMESIGFYTLPAGYKARIISRTHNTNSNNNNCDIILHKLLDRTNTSISAIDRQGIMAHNDIAGCIQGTIQIQDQPTMLPGDSVSINAYFSGTSWANIVLELELF